MDSYKTMTSTKASLYDARGPVSQLVMLLNATGLAMQGIKLDSNGDIVL